MLTSFTFRLIPWNPPVLADAVTLLNTASEISQRVGESWDDVWDLALGGTLYDVMCNAGILVAVTSVLFFTLNFAKQWLENEGSNWILTELLWPMIVIVLLANGGANLASLTLGMRNAIAHYNVTIIDAISDEVEFSRALSQIADYSTIVAQLAAEREQCNSIVNNEELQQCLEFNTIRAKAVVDEYRNRHQNQSEASAWIAELEARAEIAEADPTTSLDDVDSPSSGFNPSSMGRLPISFMGSALTSLVEAVLVASQAAFQLILEASLLLTGLIGPLAIGASLLPFGAKPVYAWITGFLSLGMGKLALNIITGLVAVCVTNMPPSDTLPTALVIGLFAPVLALAIAAGGGLAVFNGIASASTSMGGSAFGSAVNGMGSVAGSAAGRLINRKENGRSSPESTTDA